MPRLEDSPARQLLWAVLILGFILGGVLLAYELRDTELVNPQVQQREWVEWRTHPPEPPR